MAHVWRDLSVRGVVLFRGSGCLCYTNRLGNPAYIILGLHCAAAKYNFLHAVVVHVCIWEGNSFPENTEYVLKCFVMWNSAKWIPLPIFHHNSPTISIAETVYDMHVRVFFICKCVWRFNYDCTATQHSHTRQ
jgi:hypothetical protein